MPCRIDEVSKAPAMAIQPGQRLFGIFRRWAIFHREELLGYAHSTRLTPSLCDRMTIIRRIPASNTVFQLPLNIVEQSAGAKAEEVRLHPRSSQLFLHHRQPLGRLLGSANPAPRLQAHAHPPLLLLLPDGP